MARGHGRGAGAAAKRALGVGRVRGAGAERLRRERTCVVNVAPVSAMKRSPTCAALLPYFLPISAQAAFASPESALRSGDHACTTTPRFLFASRVPAARGVGLQLPRLLETYEGSCCHAAEAVAVVL